MPFVERLRRGHLVVRLSAVTHLAQCRTEQLVSMSSRSRNSLNDSQVDNAVPICVIDSPLAQSARNYSQGARSA